MKKEKKPPFYEDWDSEEWVVLIAIIVAIIGALILIVIGCMTDLIGTLVITGFIALIGGLITAFCMWDSI